MATRVYGWRPVAMFENLSLGQLTDLMQWVQNDPKSANPLHASGHSIFLYTKAARKKLDAIGWAITYHLKKEPRP